MDGFSVIIPTRYTSGALKFCYETLKKHSRLEHEYIIICDIYTSWQTYKWLQENEIMYYEANLCNWYSLMNFGATKATKEYLAFFQDDLLISEDWDINMARYLNHNILLAPTYLQGFEIGNGFGFETGSKVGALTQDDFRMNEFNQYCREHAKDGLRSDVFGFFPEVIAKETFDKLNGYTTFTWKDDMHLHHEDGIKYRLSCYGGGNFQVKNVFSFHFPNIFRDRSPLYGYYINRGAAHYPLICNTCGLQQSGAELEYQEVFTAMHTGCWKCNNCR